MNLQARIKHAKRLDDLIRCKQTGELPHLANKFGVCVSTMIRYLEEFKTDFDAPVAFDRMNKRYYYTEPFELIIQIEVCRNGIRKKL